MNKIIKFENLENDLSSVLFNLGIKNFKLVKKVNSNYREKDPIVTNEQKKIIYDCFKSSLKFINYDINKI